MAFRQAVERAGRASPHLRASERATLDAIFALTIGYSRLSDRLSIRSDIAPLAGLSEMRVRAAIPRLVELGLIEVKGAERQRYTYSIPAPSATPGGVQKHQEGRSQPCDPRRTQAATPGGATSEKFSEKREGELRPDCTHPECLGLDRCRYDYDLDPDSIEQAKLLARRYDA